MSNATPEDFTGKYTSTNPVSRWLVDNFFTALESIVPSADDVTTVLEIGCGAGYSMQRIRKLFPHADITASDVDPKLVEEAARRNPDVRFLTESIYQMSHNDASFDLVICLEVLEHLEHPLEAMQELRRVTKRYCLISVPREPIWRMLNMVRLAHLTRLGNTPGHLQHWSSRGFMKQVGTLFHVDAVRKPLPWTMVLGKKATDPAPA